MWASRRRGAGPSDGYPWIWSQLYVLEVCGGVGRRVDAECKMAVACHMCFFLLFLKYIQAGCSRDFGSLSMNILRTLYPRFAGVAFDIPGFGLTPRPSSLIDYGEAAAADLGLRLWKRLSWPLSSSPSGMHPLYLLVRNPSCCCCCCCCSSSSSSSSSSALTPRLFTVPPPPPPPAGANILMGHSLGGCVALRIHNKAESGGQALVLVAPALPSFLFKTEKSAPARTSPWSAFAKVLALLCGWSAYLALRAASTLLSPIITLVVKLAVPKTDSVWAWMMVCSSAPTRGFFFVSSHLPSLFV